MWSALKGDILDFVSTIKQDVAAMVNIEELEHESNASKTRQAHTNVNESSINELANSRATFTEVRMLLDISFVCSVLYFLFI